MTKGFKGRAIATVLAAMLTATSHAQDAGSGQDVGTGTPPELRDFRLDQPPPRPAPDQTAPQPEPMVAPPPLAPTVEAQPRRQSPRPVRRPEPSPRRSSAVVQPPPPATVETAVPEAVSDIPPRAPQPEESGAPEFDQSGPAASTGPATMLWIGGGAALLAALIAAALFWRRRRRTPQAEAQVELPVPPAEQPSPPTRLAGPSGPVAARLPEPQSTAIDGETLTVHFAPTSAQLSIASLTVTGRLTVENRSGKAATNMILRSQMISAQDGQREAIAAFHANRTDGETQPLGDMAPGERIDAIIEIRLPRSELHAFRWTEREFVAPIVLVNVAGQIEGQAVEARLSQLIGREGANASPRMKPLAIDRGPKRYSAVDARPVFA